MLTTGVPIHMPVDTDISREGASCLILMTLALATLSTVMFLLTVAEVPAEALFVVLAATAASRRMLWRRGQDMSLTGRVPTVPRARVQQS